MTYSHIFLVAIFSETNASVAVSLEKCYTASLSLPARAMPINLTLSGISWVRPLMRTCQGGRIYLEATIYLPDHDLETFRAALGSMPAQYSSLDLSSTCR